jgi:hypothetical protein
VGGMAIPSDQVSSHFSAPRPNKLMQYALAA